MFERRTVQLAGLLLTLAGAVAHAQDVAHGKTIFIRCSACHTIDGGAPKMGPDLKTVVGRTAGSLPGYAYSTAMKGEKISWTSRNLDGFLTKPQDFVKGTKMFFPGLPTATDRADVIAYLKSLKAAK